MRAQIDAALLGKPVRLARIETVYNKGDSPDVAIAVSIDELNALAPTDFFVSLYRHRYADAPPDELLAAFHELLIAPAEGAEPS